MTIHNLEISTAHFTNNERTEIEAMLFAEESTEDHVVLIPFHIEAKAGDADYEWLTSKIDIDIIHENTFNKFRRENEEFRSMIEKVGTEMEILGEGELIANKYNKIIDVLEKPFDPKDDKEKLFKLKLKVFEMDAVRSSKDRPIKAKLRKATTLLDVMIITCELLKTYRAEKQAKWDEEEANGLSEEEIKPLSEEETKPLSEEETKPLIDEV